MRVVGFESRWVALCVSGRSDDFCTPHEGSWDDLSGGALMSQPLRESVGPGYVVKHFRGRPHKKFCTSSKYKTKSRYTLERALMGEGERQRGERERERD